MPNSERMPWTWDLMPWNTQIIATRTLLITNSWRSKILPRIHRHFLTNLILLLVLVVKIVTFILQKTVKANRRIRYYDHRLTGIFCHEPVSHSWFVFCISYRAFQTGSSDGCDTKVISLATRTIINYIAFSNCHDSCSIALCTKKRSGTQASLLSSLGLDRNSGRHLSSPPA